MPEKSNPPDNVIRFPVEAVSRLGYKRAGQARRARSTRMEQEGQLTLFHPGEHTPPMGEVVELPLQMTSFEQALLLDEQGDVRAEDIYVRAIENEDRAADAWCNLGVLKSVGGDLDGAFSCFAHSLTADPRHAESHYNIGNLYFEIGDLRVARTHYEMSVDIDEEFANAFFNLGLVAALSEDYPGAHAALTRYKTLDPGADSEGIADELLGYIRTAINLS